MALPYHPNVHPPADAAHFEELCTALCMKLFNDPLTGRVGRNGQSQNGIDIRGTDRISGGNEKYGVQCKVINNQPNAKEFMNLISSDLEKIRKSDMKYVIFATTIKRDVHIQNEIEKESKNIKYSGGPEISVWSWDDIVEKIKTFEELHYMLYGNYDAKDMWIENLFDSWSGIVCPDTLSNCIRYESFILVRYSLIDSIGSLEFLINAYRTTLPENNTAKKLFHELEVYCRIVNDLHSFIRETEGEVTERYETYFNDKSDNGFYTYFIKLDYPSGYTRYISMMNRIITILYEFMIRQSNRIISFFNKINSQGRDVKFSKAKISDFHNHDIGDNFTYVTLCYDENIHEYTGVADIVHHIKCTYALKEHEIPNIE